MILYHGKSYDYTEFKQLGVGDRLQLYSVFVSYRESLISAGLMGIVSLQLKTRRNFELYQFAYLALVARTGYLNRKDIALAMRNLENNSDPLFDLHMLSPRMINCASTYGRSLEILVKERVKSKSEVIAVSEDNSLQCSDDDVIVPQSGEEREIVIQRVFMTRRTSFCLGFALAPLAMAAVGVLTPTIACAASARLSITPILSVGEELLSALSVASKNFSMSVKGILDRSEHVFHYTPVDYCEMGSTILSDDCDLASVPLLEVCKFEPQSGCEAFYADMLTQAEEQKKLKLEKEQKLREKISSYKFDKKNPEIKKFGPGTSTGYEAIFNKYDLVRPQDVVQVTPEHSATRTDVPRAFDGFSHIR